MNLINLWSATGLHAWTMNTSTALGQFTHTKCRNRVHLFSWKCDALCHHSPRESMWTISRITYFTGVETATIKWGGKTLPCHQAFLSSSSNIMQNGRKNEERKAWDQSFAKLEMWQSQVENEHYSTVSGLIRLVISLECFIEITPDFLWMIDVHAQ